MKIEANKNFFSWIELAKNKNSLVSVAFDRDLSFASFVLFGQPSVEGNEHSPFCQLNKLPIQKFPFQLNQLKGIQMDHLCLLSFLSFGQNIQIKQNEANGVSRLFSYVAAVWQQSGRQITSRSFASFGAFGGTFN